VDTTRQVAATTLLAWFDDLVDQSVAGLGINTDTTVCLDDSGDQTRHEFHLILAPTLVQRIRLVWVERDEATDLMEILLVSLLNVLPVVRSSRSA